MTASNPTSGRDVARSRSKQLLGGLYRAEVGRGITELPEGHWTVAQLERMLPDVPRSCLNKELSTLRGVDFIRRHGKNDRGEYLYTTAGVAEYWAAARALMEAAEPPVAHSNVVPLRSSSGEHE